MPDFVEPDILDINQDNEVIGLDLRDKNFINMNLKGVRFVDCKINTSTNFSGSDFREAIFANTPIHLAQLGNCVGNSKEIGSCHLMGRPIVMTKRGFYIDCLYLSSRPKRKEQLVEIAKENPKENQSVMTAELTEIMYRIWEIKFKKKEK